MTAPQARWLSDAQVAALLPPPAEAAELARSVLVGLAEGTIELPPKPAIHPRPDGFVNVMPAYCGGLDGSGVKLVSVFPENRALGLPAINALVIVLDSATGLVRGLLGGAALTACRTAAASAACIPRLAPPGARPRRAHRRRRRGAHATCSRSTRSRCATSSSGITARRTSRRCRPGRPSTCRAVTLRTAGSASEAADGAGDRHHGHPDRRAAAAGSIPRRCAPDVLALPIDYSTSIPAETANDAALLLADDVAQLDGYRSAHFINWRPLDGPVGRWLADGAPPRPEGQIVVANLGVGAHDVVFGSAVLARAERDGVGVLVTP